MGIQHTSYFQFIKNKSLVMEMYPRSIRLFRFISFLSHVEIGGPNECWEWKGSVSSEGYGQFRWPEKKVKLAHVAAYVFFIGRVRKRSGRRLCVCHSCDNPPCVNPKHLWLGTQQQNIADMIKKGRGSYPGHHQQKSGEDAANAKLSAKDVRKIRKLYATGKYTQKELGKKFGVIGCTIGAITSGYTWVN
jgi:hypothetical protein